MIKNLLLLIVMFISITLNAQKGSKKTNEFISEINQKIPQLLEDFMVPGTAIAIIENGEIILQKGYGFSDISKGIKVNSKTSFNIGSISKTIAAWGVMKLVEEGKIKLDAPAEKYLSRWHFPKSKFNSEEVTIRQLLSHTAGLSLHGYPGWSLKDTLSTIEESLNGRNNGPGPVEIILKPGKTYKYSGGGFTVLQLIIEEVTGQKFEDYMQTQILNPLGMTNSSYKIDDRIMASSSLEYDKFCEEIDFELFTAQAAAGLHITLEDFTRFAMANLYQMQDFEKQNSVLSADIIQEMMKPVPQANGRFGYGLGYMIESIPGTSVLLAGHRGANTGWHAIFNVNPETNDGFIMMTNGGAGQDIYHQIFFDWALWKLGVSLENWYNSKPSIANKLKPIIDSKGVEEISSIYGELKKIHSEKFDFSEHKLDQLGYYYLNKDDLKKSIAVFKLNTEIFPKSYNVYNSYAKALLRQGDKENAIENYKKSVILNPGNQAGFMALQELGVPSDDLIVKVPVDHLELLAGEYTMLYDKGWKILFEVVNEEFVGNDGNYKFWLYPVGNNEFVNGDDANSLVFDTKNQNANTMVLSGKYKFLKTEPSKPSIAKKLKNLIDSTGIDNIQIVCNEFKKTQSDKYDFSEMQLNDLGYHYFGKDDFEKAETIFKLNIEAFPKAFNVYDSYGEMLLAKGMKEDAIKNYKKSVKLNPGNTNGINVLQNLGVSTEDLIKKVSVDHLKLLAGEYIMKDDEEWKLKFEVLNEELVCKDGDYKIKIFPIGNNNFVNMNDGGSLVFDTSDENAVTMILFEKFEFKKVD